jgi:hypothetical protein
MAGSVKSRINLTKHLLATLSVHFEFFRCRFANEPQLPVEGG